MKLINPRLPALTDRLIENSLLSRNRSGLTQRSYGLILSVNFKNIRVITVPAGNSALPPVCFTLTILRISYHSPPLRVPVRQFNSLNA